MCDYILRCETTYCSDAVLLPRTLDKVEGQVLAEESDTSHVHFVDNAGEFSVEFVADVVSGAMSRSLLAAVTFLPSYSVDLDTAFVLDLAGNFPCVVCS